MDELRGSAIYLLRTFSGLCEAGHLDAALAAVSRLIIARRHDVLLRSVLPSWACCWCKTRFLPMS